MCGLTRAAEREMSTSQERSAERQAEDQAGETVWDTVYGFVSAAGTAVQTAVNAVRRGMGAGREQRRAERGFSDDLAFSDVGDWDLSLCGGHPERNSVGSHGRQPHAPESRDRELAQNHAKVRGTCTGTGYLRNTG